MLNFRVRTGTGVVIEVWCYPSETRLEVLLILDIDSPQYPHAVQRKKTNTFKKILEQREKKLEKIIKSKKKARFNLARRSVGMTLEP